MPAKSHSQMAIEARSAATRRRRPAAAPCPPEEDTRDASVSLALPRFRRAAAGHVRAPARPPAPEPRATVAAHSARSFGPPDFPTLTPLPLPQEVMNGAESLVRAARPSRHRGLLRQPRHQRDAAGGGASTREPGLRGVLVPVRGVASGAADGYGRMAEKPALTLLHLGPGHGNAVANLHNAQARPQPDRQPDRRPRHLAPPLQPAARHRHQVAGPPGVRLVPRMPVGRLAGQGRAQGDRDGVDQAGGSPP